MSEAVVRRFDPSDRAAVVGLTIELQEHERALRASRAPGEVVAAAYVARLVDELGTGNGAIFVAEAAGAVVGFAACIVAADPLEREPPEVVLRDLVVTASARRRGVGRALAAAVEAFAREHGIARLCVVVLAGNWAAERTYAALGFACAFRALERQLDRG